MQFAEWALAAGVPADRIHLFLSSADTTKFQDRLTKAKIAARPATDREINGFVNDELKDLSGDLLYWFWSGHGSISENSERLLFFEDLRNDSQPSLDLSHLMKRLRSQPYGRFRRQVAYVDACANRFEDLGFKYSAGVVRPGLGKLVTSVRQLFFLAADSGNEALAGKFSQAILQALRKQHDAGQRLWPPDPDTVRKAVGQAFEGSQQRPVQIAWSTESGDEYSWAVSGDLPASEYVNGMAREVGYPVRFLRRLTAMAALYTAAGSDARRDALYQRLSAQPAPVGRAARLSPELDMLRLIAKGLQQGSPEALRDEVSDPGFSAELNRLTLLRDVRALLVNLEQATMADFQEDYAITVMPLEPAPERLNAHTLDAMLDELTQVHVDDAYRFLWQFLLRVATHQPEARRAIDTLIREHSSPVLLRTIRDELQKEQRFLLSVSIEPAESGQFLPGAVEAKLLFAGTVTVVRPLPRIAVDTWPKAEQAAVELVGQARKIVMGQLRKSDRDLDIEFLLPYGCFQQAPDEFILRLAAPTALGRVHPVVVRCRARIVERWDWDLTLWQAAGNRIDRKAKGMVEWLDPTGSKNAGPVYQTCKGLLALDFLPRDEIEDLVTAGYPFIAWLRSDPAGGWDAFKQRFAEWAHASPFEQLPRGLPEIRRNPGDLGESLTMFWDDPNYTEHWPRAEEPTT
jgi:hypothetical protein